MPDIVVVRHAIAEERDATRWPDDSLRPLTAVGRERFAEAALGLARLVERPARLLASPYVRTRQTAEILADVADWPAPEDAPALAAHAPAHDALALAASLEPGDPVVLVGHEPTTTLLTRALLRPDDAARVEWFKKGAAAYVRADGTLAWMHQPKALRAVGATRSP